jgi:hypothetical protein
VYTHTHTCTHTHTHAHTHTCTHTHTHVCVACMINHHSTTQRSALRGRRLQLRVSPPCMTLPSFSLGRQSTSDTCLTASCQWQRRQQHGGSSRVCMCCVRTACTCAPAGSPTHLLQLQIYRGFHAIEIDGLKRGPRWTRGRAATGVPAQTAASRS